MENLCPREHGLVAIALHLAQRNRAVRSRAIGIAHPIGGILPSLVCEPAAARVDVSHKSSLLRLRLNPPQGSLESRDKPFNFLVLCSGLPCLVQQDDPKRRGVNRAVVDRWQKDTATEVLTGCPHFVQDLSLIHISEPTRLGVSSYAVFCLKKKK